MLHLPRTLSDGRIVVDELCLCGALRTEHAGPIGHGVCQKSNCAKFSWGGHIFYQPDAAICDDCGKPEHDCRCCDCPKCAAHRYEDAGARAPAGGPDLPAPPTPGAKFAAVGANVVMVNETIATARSNNMAARIANALNAYIPGRRGH